GLGSIGQRHVRNLRALLGSDVEISAYRVRGLPHVITPAMGIEPDADVEWRYGITAFSDLDAALASEPDAAFVTSPNSLHMPVALGAADGGCHLFIEKPIAHTLSGVDELDDRLEVRRRVGLVGYQFRFHPGFRVVQAMLESRAIGASVAARFEFGEYL